MQVAGKLVNSLLETLLLIATILFFISIHRRKQSGEFQLTVLHRLVMLALWVAAMLIAEGAIDAVADLFGAKYTPQPLPNQIAINLLTGSVLLFIYPALSKWLEKRDSSRQSNR
jgi:hypothetical protein